MKYKMVIFDLDGTLCDTLEDLHIACNYALSQCKLQEITLEQTRNFVGNGIRNLLIKASNSLGNIEELLKFFKTFYNQNSVIYTAPYPYIKDVLSYCKEKGLYLGVLTNKVESMAKKIVEALFDNSFDFVYGDVPNRAKKPNEVFLLEIIRNYGLKPEEVLYIGDSEVDIETVRNASCEGAFVSYGFRDKATLLMYTNRIADSPLELIKFIGE